MRFLLPLLAAVAALTGCSSKDDEPTHVPAIHIESADSSRFFGREIELPLTNLRYPIIAQPVVPEGNFISADVYEVGETHLRRKVLLARVDAKAAANLYAVTTKARDKRLFLLVNDQPVGVHLIQAPIAGGDVYFDIEVPAAGTAERDRAIMALCDDLNASILAIRKAKQKK